MSAVLVEPTGYFHPAGVHKYFSHRMFKNSPNHLLPDLFLFMLCPGSCLLYLHHQPCQNLGVILELLHPYQSPRLDFTFISACLDHHQCSPLNSGFQNFCIIVVPNLAAHQNHQRNFEITVLGPIHRDFDLVDLGWGPTIFTFNKQTVLMWVAQQHRGV